MPALDTLNLPAIDAALRGAADLMNSVYLPAATPDSVALALGVILAAIPALLSLLWLARRFTTGPRADITLAQRVDDLDQRLQATELLLAAATGDTELLRQRVNELTSRQESFSAGNSRSSLRQAIALSKHGATTRQLIDTCSLTQGEAHLIQTLYGRPPADGQSGELH